MPRATAIRRAIVAALRDAGLAPADVGFVVAHGLSTVDDDRIEAQAIRDTLGDVPVTAPKSYFGHLGAAAGSLETAVSVLAFQHGLVPPTLNYEQPDPQCPDQRDPRPADALGPPHRADPQPHPARPGGGGGAGGSGVVACDCASYAYNEDVRSGRSYVYACCHRH